LGIAHAQGYYLGRPGSRDRAMAPQLREWLQERCASARASRMCELMGNRVMRLAQPALVAHPGRTVADAWADLRQAGAAPGLVIVDKGRYEGWCTRRDVLAAARSGGSGKPV